MNKNRYTDETKKEIAADFAQSGLTARQYSRNVGISIGLLYKWKKKYITNAPKATTKRKATANTLSKDSIDKRIRDLTSELSALKHLKTEAKRLGVKL